MIAVLQFDAAGAALLEPLLAAGRLPNLAALGERGRRVELASPAAHFPASAYQSLYRGVEVGEHGLFYPFQWSASEQRIRLAPRFAAPPPIWERLARANRTTLAIDPYECHPPGASAGVTISGWGMRERVVLGRWSRPPGFDRALRRRHGAPPDVTEVFGEQDARERAALRERFLAAPTRVADAALELLRDRSFDLVWLTFAAPHLAGHRLWEPLSGAPASVPDGALAEIYERTDEQLGRVLQALPDDCDVIACSVLGMDANTSRADMLPAMVAAVLAGEGAAGGRNGDDGDSGAIWRLRGAVPRRARSAAANAIPARVALELTTRLELRGVDWPATAAFAHPADNQGYVRFNLRGREADGSVDPAAADELAARIATGLADFRDPDGEPAVAAVDRVADAWEGPLAGRLPDLVVRWRPTPAMTIAALDSERFGVVPRSGVGSGRTGNHTDGDAWAILAPGAARHRGPADPARPARIVDLAATVAAVCGVRDDGLAGEPLLER